MSGDISDFTFKRVDTGADMSSYFSRQTAQKMFGDYSLRGNTGKDNLISWIKHGSITIATEGQIEGWFFSGDRLALHELHHGPAYGIDDSGTPYDGGCIAWLDSENDRFRLGNLNVGSLVTRDYEDFTFDTAEFYRLVLYFYRDGGDLEAIAKLYSWPFTLEVSLAYTFVGATVGTDVGILEETKTQYSYMDEYKIYDYS